MDEEEFVRESKKGDEEAFSALVEAYKNKVFHLTYSLVRNKEIADDLAQEVFIKAYLALPQFKERSRFGTWLYQIALNHTRDFLRKKAPLTQVPFEEKMAGSQDREDEIMKRENETEREAKRQIIHQAIRALPDKYQVILALRDIQGLPYDEISRVLRVSPGTVDSRIHRARKKLREKVKTVMAGKERCHELP
ncbi:MAG: sigma-70 family RNA polymerase sigma factor [Candidatus Aminicenantes bacterium]|nr:sigma-70 family RNA polymerase sigma factor [Candidatus Aminicenantes bacterium]